MARFDPPADEVRTYREEYGVSLLEAKQILRDRAKTARLDELLSEAESLLPHAYSGAGHMSEAEHRRTNDRHQLLGALIRALRILTREEEQ